MPTDTHSVYRFFSTDGTLLYVGVTDWLPLRLQDHNHGKTWWADVETVEVEHFPTRQDAEAAELHAIQTENPVHNIAGRTSATRDLTYWHLSHLEPQLQDLKNEILAISEQEPRWTSEFIWYAPFDYRTKVKKLVGEWARADLEPDALQTPIHVDEAWAVAAEHFIGYITSLFVSETDYTDEQMAELREYLFGPFDEDDF